MNMAVENRMTAPNVDHYIDSLGDINYRNYNDDTTYDEHSYSLINELFSRIQQVEPAQSNGSLIWSLWFHASRGPMEDFGDCEDWIQSGDAASREDFIRIWHDFYPDEEEWYPVTLFEDSKTAYRGVVVRHRHVIEVDPEKPHQRYPMDISPFVQWLIDSLDDCIHQLREGTYNEFVDHHLPPQHRTGTILRNDYWAIFPEYREAFFKELNNEEAERAITLMCGQPDIKHFEERFPKMTANIFYSACAIGYIANKYEITDCTPKEMYYRHADGRDEGLGDLDPDSEVDFRKWFHDPHRGGGHPWEVCRGGNSTHIDLRVTEDEKGYFLYLAGRSEGRCVEAIKFYLSLRAAHIPVFIYDAKELVARLRGEERIGIVPESVIPRYCSSWFPNEGIIDFMNLPYERREEVVAHTTWQQLEPVQLAKTS